MNPVLVLMPSLAVNSSHMHRIEIRLWPESCYAQSYERLFLKAVLKWIWLFSNKICICRHNIHIAGLISLYEEQLFIIRCSVAGYNCVQSFFCACMYIYARFDTTDDAWTVDCATRAIQQASASPTNVPLGGNLTISISSHTTIGQSRATTRAKQGLGQHFAPVSAGLSNKPPNHSGLR